VGRLVRRLWDSDTAVGHGVVWRPAELPGLIAVEDTEVVGLLTYTVVPPDAVEIVTIDALRPHVGIGTLLLDGVAEIAIELGAEQLVLTTTNDNIDAIRFYQRRGFHLTGLRPGAVAESRKLKPEIPLVGAYRISITDELVLARPLS
jgi:ribosomal protein S18 acetylase RimI-like enzyme